MVSFNPEITVVEIPQAQAYKAELKGREVFYIVDCKTNKITTLIQQATKNLITPPAPPPTPELLNC